MFAARQGSVEAARMLLDAGADVNHAAEDGSTALFVAAASLAIPNNGLQEVGALLLERGADITPTGLSYTALHVAVASGKPALVSALLAHGADPNARVAPTKKAGSGMRYQAGATPFWLAARAVQPQTMRTLLAHKADPSMSPDDGTTALMTAAGVGQVEGPRARNAFLSPYRSNWDETRALEAVELLVALGSDINAVNKSKGWTALHGAAHIGADRMVEWLVRHGAAVDVKDKIGQTAWSLATEGARDQLTRTPHPSTAELLRKLGADPEFSR
jgi:ankyrin repeat protein